MKTPKEQIIELMTGVTIEQWNKNNDILSKQNKYLTTSKINRAIKHLDMEIIHERGSGYSYFLDLNTGLQVGESVCVCYLYQLPLERWVDEAVEARNND